MPAMSGAEFLAQVRRDHPDTIRIILTGQASLESAIRAINEGEIFRFLTKPCSPVDLGQAIHHALLLKNLSRESGRLVAAAREQRSLIDELERRHPGITKVERTEDGRILLDDATDNVESLLDAIRKQMGGA
jgi:DNA-binding NtrC family response regulator